MNGKLLCGCLVTTGVVLLLIISFALALHERIGYEVVYLTSALLEQHTAPSNPASATSRSHHRQCKDRLKHRTLPAEINALLVDIGLLDKYVPSPNLKSIDEDDASPPRYSDEQVKVCTTNRGASTQCIPQEVLDLIREEAANALIQREEAANALIQRKLTCPGAPKKKKKHAALCYSSPPACEIVNGELAFPSIPPLCFHYNALLVDKALIQRKLTCPGAPKKKKKHAALCYSSPPACEIVNGELVFPSIPPLCFHY
jgi:hypothetical protein